MFPMESVVYILRRHLTWKQIAEAMGVSVQDARRWSGMVGDDPDSFDDGVLWRLSMLCNIVHLLEDGLGSRRLVTDWLRSRNNALDFKSVFAVFHEKGGPAKVRAAAKAYVQSMRATSHALQV